MSKNVAANILDLKTSLYFLFVSSAIFLSDINLTTVSTRITNINEEIIAQSEIQNKIEGEISFLSNDKGFIHGEDGFDYYFTKQYIIESDSQKTIWRGKRLKFNPSLLGDSKMATEIEVLKSEEGKLREVQRQKEIDALMEKMSNTYELPTFDMIG